MDFRFTKEEKTDFFKLLEMAYEHLYLPIINVAVGLKIFDYLSEYKQVSQIAAEAGTAVKDLEILLNSLAALGLLEKKDVTYKTKDSLRKFLQSGNENFIGSYHERIYHIYKKVPSFIEIVKTGKHPEKKEEDPQFFKQLVTMMFHTNIVPASDLAEHHEGEINGLLKEKGSISILDVGAGSGVWSIPFSKINKNIYVDALDFEKVLEITGEFAERYGVSGQYNFIAGDMNTIEWVKEKYDFILFGNICNTVSLESLKTIFGKAKKGLTHDGRIVIIDMIPEEKDLSLSKFPVIFSILMSLITSEGSTRTVSEYKEILSELGYKEFNTFNLLSYHSKILVAR